VGRPELGDHLRPQLLAPRLRLLLFWLWLRRLRGLVAGAATPALLRLLRLLLQRLPLPVPWLRLCSHR
jgi:hypothetical protein